MTNLYMWLSTKNGVIIDHRFVELNNVNTVTWGQHATSQSRWPYIFNGADGGFMLMEFSLGYREPTRHLLDEIDDETFELRPMQDDIYKQKYFWEASSQGHWYPHRVIMKKVDMKHVTSAESKPS